MNADVERGELRELDHRSGDGIEVSLLWNAGTGEVFVAVEDTRDGRGFSVAVDPAAALDAFHHPYAVAA